MNIEIKKQESAVSYDITVTPKTMKDYDNMYDWCSENNAVCLINCKNCMVQDFLDGLQFSRVYPLQSLIFSFDKECDAVIFKLMFSEYL